MSNEEIIKSNTEQIRTVLSKCISVDSSGIAIVHETDYLKSKLKDFSVRPYLGSEFVKKEISNYLKEQGCEIDIVQFTGKIFFN